MLKIDRLLVVYRRTDVNASERVKIINAPYSGAAFADMFDHTIGWIAHGSTTG
ncbi:MULTISPECIES: hypothetical protein [Citrobacter]|jgi:hypothetical protein|uniref:hypothetical protein n=1 Tax=Citrobacter TaxID=544 RepID=UPI001CD3EDF3|nr:MULTISPECIES: hypothetical protein [Citrobacter]MDT3756877.1 hypothetical protein [Citrobacter freundii complex sp. 2023EL-00962]MCC0139407.1 hypothetical protein [Citrobacter freundii]MCO5618453.1 hypothetical protein [Citrobacter freundii]MCO5628102.1 hypothetical protein [Citrobacter freundii]MCO5633794.1 hypothetical protein [Citrobacter freundii]